MREEIAIFLLGRTIVAPPQTATTLRAEFPRIPMPLCLKEYADAVQNDG